MRPHVSVIIPTFNRYPMLIEAVRSVLAQNDVRFELIVVDDGSTDATATGLAGLLADALASRSAFSQTGYYGLCAARLERTEHCGVGAARNRGAVLARGEFLAFLDSDDLWAPLKLSRQLDFMLSLPRYSLSQTEEIWIRNGRRVNPGQRHRKRSGDLFIDSLRTCLISPSAAMLRRELFFAFGGFDHHLKACEDYDLWLRILSRHEVGLLDEPLVTRRAGHADQLSATIPALDRFRVITLLKLLRDSRLDQNRIKMVCDVLAQKCRILSAGLARRRKVWLAELYARAGAMADKVWRFGELRELPRLTRALVDCGLRSNNFSRGFDHTPDDAQDEAKNMVAQLSDGSGLKAVQFITTRSAAQEPLPQQPLRRCSGGENSTRYPLARLDAAAGLSNGGSS
jgi:GT2 family glycosyltransferase